MEHIFLTVLGMSGTASLVILAVLLARLLLRKAPKIYSYILWSVVLFRLLCPFAIQSRWGMVLPIQVEFSTDSMVSIDTDRTEVVISVGDAPGYAPAPVGSSAPAQLPDPPSAPAPAVPPTQTAPAAPGWPSVAGAVWLAGALLLLGYSAVSLFLLRRKLTGSVPLAGEKNVRLADHIPSPFVLGLARPKIYLPSDLPEEEREYILLHERTHIRRLDHVTRALAWLALSVHWFNPLVWLAFHLAGKDMEMSCDEAVLRKMGRDVRADYSTSLLRLSVGGRLPAGPLAFGGGDTQKRIKNVLNYKKPSFWVAAVALIAVLCAGVALVTNPSGILDSPEPDDELSFAFSDSGEQVLIFGSRTVEMWWHIPRQANFWDWMSPLGGLSFHGLPLSSGQQVFGVAKWSGENRNAVSMELLCAGLSTLDFTVLTGPDYAPEQAIIERKVLGQGEDPIDASDEEVAELAAYFARCLLAAEEWYQQQNGADNAAGLTMSIDQTGADPFVRVSGSVYGTELRRAIWHPEEDGYSLLGKHPGGELTMEYSFAAGECTLGAWWPDDTRTSVALSTKLTTMYSSYIPCGWWEFAVDLSSGTVTTMESHGGETTISDPVRYYPDSITDAEAVRTARAAAKVLTAAEDYYNSHIGDWQAPPSYAPVYTMDGGDVLIEGIGDAHVRWGSVIVGADSRGSLYFAGDPVYYCSRLAGKAVEGGAYWSDENTFQVNFNVNDERVPGGTISGFRIAFTVDMDTAIILQRDFKSMVDGETLELTDLEMVETAVALSELIQGAKDFYDNAAAPETGPLPFQASVKLILASGAGSWGTLVALHPDGSFQGDYSDTDGETMYVCQFHGRFGNIRQATPASWSMTLEELVLDTGHPIGEEWEDPGDIFHYISSEPVGFTKPGGDGHGVILEPGAEFFLYTPEASSKPGGELYGMENPSSDLHDFWLWWPGNYNSSWKGDLLGCYGLRNVEGGCGFFDSWMS